MTAADYTTEDPVVRLAFSNSVLDVAHDYFGGRLTLDSIQGLYSWPTEGLSDSQMWHKDYGDSRSFHWIAYLNDVSSDLDGPFVFVDRQDTRRIARSPFIRRIDDQRFMKELGDGQVRRFTGKAGESVYVDPSACYHYGSRCRQPRLAIFITVNSDRPFVAATDLVRHNARRLLDVGRALRGPERVLPAHVARALSPADVRPDRPCVLLFCAAIRSWFTCAIRNPLH